MKNSHVGWFSRVTLFVLLLVTYWTAHRLAPASGSTIARPRASSSKTKAAGDFALRTLDGRTVRLSDLRGKVVLLNFWATWCAPCRVEMPWFVEFYKQYRPEGLEIVGVSMDDPGEEKAIAEFIEDRNVNYTILKGNNAVAELYGGLRFLPQTYFIDAKGNILKSTLGVASKDAFEASIKQLLATRNR